MAPTQPRLLGRSGIEVAPIAFGGNVFGWTADESASFDLLDAFVAHGFNLIDTANTYSTWVPGHQGGESEAVIGNWLKISGKRDSVVLATKVGMKMGDGSSGLKKDYILQSAEASFTRLQTDHIDLYQFHQDDADTPLEESLEALDTLLKQGKIRAVGLSNYPPSRIEEALRLSSEKSLPAIVSLQPEYNLYSREDYEKNLEHACLAHDLAVIPYWSLASGFLTGKYRSTDDLNKSPRGQSIGQRYLNDRGHAILKAMDAVAASHETTLAPIALAWLIQRKSITAPIASATSVPQLTELLKAVDIRLTADQVKQLDDASAY